MLDIQPMTGRIGAEIAGLDLRRPIPAELAAALLAALDAHQVLVFRRQFLDLAQQKALTQVFGLEALGRPATLGAVVLASPPQPKGPGAPRLA